MVQTKSDSIDEIDLILEKKLLGTAIPAPPFQWASVSDAGQIRKENEDAFFVSPELALLVVSDGMGGHRGGALASKIVTEDLPVMVENMLANLKSESTRSVRTVFKKTIIEQSKQLRMEGESESGYKEMGATLVMALLKKGRAYVGNLGDSRIYLMRKGKLSQITKDHSVVSELLDKGKIKPDEAEDHEAHGQLTHYIGMEEDVLPHVRTLALQKHDRLLLCTDGLTDMVSDKEIAEILNENPDLDKACKTLVKKANATGGHDNITVILADWVGRQVKQP